MIFDLVAANKRRSWLLIAGFVLTVVALGVAVALIFRLGFVGVLIALVVALALTWGSYWYSDRIALSMSHAQPADPTTHARLHNLVEGLCIAAGLPKPRLYVIDDPAPNAFATGRNPEHAAVAVTTGLLEKMNRIELEAVLAHEISHIRNYDTLVMTLAVTLVGFAALVADFAFRFLWWGGPTHRNDQRDGGGGPQAILAIVGAVLIVLVPIVARLMHLALSRRREFLADASGVELTRYPPGMIAALEKLRADQTVVHSASKATAHLWIEEPLAIQKGEGRQPRLNRLFSTHPPLEERIAVLREL
jgi:heat shock protein HtpX